MNLIFTVPLAVVSTLGLHFGLAQSWPIAALIGVVLALLGRVVIVVVFDGDGSIW